MLEMNLSISTLTTSLSILNSRYIQSPVITSPPTVPTSIYELSVTLKKQGAWKKKEIDHGETYWSMRRCGGKIIMEPFAFVQRKENITEAPEIVIFIPFMQSIFKDSRLPFERAHGQQEDIICILNLTIISMGLNV